MRRNDTVIPKEVRLTIFGKIEIDSTQSTPPPPLVRVPTLDSIQALPLDVLCKHITDASILELAMPSLTALYLDLH